MSEEYFDDDFEPGAIEINGGENLIDDHEFNMRVKANNNEVPLNLTERNSKIISMISPPTRQSSSDRSSSSTRRSKAKR